MAVSATSPLLQERYIQIHWGWFIKDTEVLIYLSKWMFEIKGTLKVHLKVHFKQPIASYPKKSFFFTFLSHMIGDLKWEPYLLTFTLEREHRLYKENNYFAKRTTYIFILSREKPWHTHLPLLISAFGLLWILYSHTEVLEYCAFYLSIHFHSQSTLLKLVYDDWRGSH